MNIPIINLDPKDFPLLSKDIKVRYLGTKKDIDSLLRRAWDFISGKDIEDED